MLFDKNEAVDVGLDELYRLANECLDRRVSSLAQRCEPLAAELLRSKERFIEACDRFGRLDDEPDMEYAPEKSAGFIRGMKGPYAAALRRAVESLDIRTDAHANVYERYKRLLSSLKSALNEVEKVNGTFRQVMYCYSGKIAGCKAAFASMERVRNRLASELERRAAEIANHERVVSRISALVSQNEELDQLREGMERLAAGAHRNAGAVNAHDGSDAALDETLRTEMAALAQAEGEASRIRHEIKAMTAPLVRAAKKFDYANKSRQGLCGFMENPVGTIRTAEDYSRFVSLVAQLDRALDSELETESSKAQRESISRLVHADILSMLEAYRACEKSAHDAGARLSELKARIGAAALTRASSERSMQQSGRLSQRITDAEKRALDNKRAVEQAFLEYYKVRISIVAPH